MTRTQRLAGMLAVNLAVLAVGIVVLELLFGAWLNPDRLNRLNLIRQPLRYNVGHLYETASPVITYSRDKYGLRGNYGGDPSRIDLLTVGGSTTDQRYISDGATWQDVLQEAAAAAGTPIVVANAGVDGQSTFGHIKNFDWWFPLVPGLRPRGILFYVGGIDFYVDDETDYDALVSPDASTLGRTIRDNSAVWHLIRTVRGAYVGSRVLGIGHRRIDFATVRWTSEPLQPGYDFLSSRLDGYASRLRVLVERTRALGAEPIFVTQASRRFRLTGPGGVEGRAEPADYGGRRINGVDFYHMMKRFNGVSEAVAREKRLRFIDLFAAPIWVDADFYDFNHLGPQGTRKLGLALFQELKGQLPELRKTPRP